MKDKNYEVCKVNYKENRNLKKSYIINNKINLINAHKNYNLYIKNLENENLRSPQSDNIQPVEDRDNLQQNQENEMGYLSVSVLTALGALPVQGAVVTVYTYDEDGNEKVISHLVTDDSGLAPTIELPVLYNLENEYESREYFFENYNLRIQALNYYTVNILDMRIFPDTTTTFRVDLIPAMPGNTRNSPDQTFVIPPSPIDISN